MKNSLYLMVFIFLISGCSVTSIFEKEGGISLKKIRNASMDEVINYLEIPKNKYKTYIKKGSQYLTYTVEKKQTRGRSFSGSFYSVSIDFSFGKDNKLGFIKIVHSYTGKSSGRKSHMKGEYQSMCRAFTKELGDFKTQSFGVGSTKYRWNVKTNDGGSISVHSVPPKDEGKSKYGGHHYMVITKVYLK